jgi:hypothetical protein
MNITVSQVHYIAFDVHEGTSRIGNETRYAPPPTVTVDGTTFEFQYEEDHAGRTIRWHYEKSHDQA